MFRLLRCECGSALLLVAVSRFNYRLELIALAITTKERVSRCKVTLFVSFALLTRSKLIDSFSLSLSLSLPSPLLTSNELNCLCPTCVLRVLPTGGQSECLSVLPSNCLRHCFHLPRSHLLHIDHICFFTLLHPSN